MKFIGTKRIETNRLILRKITRNDAYQAYTSWCTDADVCKYLPWSKHKDVNETLELYTMWENTYDDETFRWIVELKDNHEVIGTIDVISREYLYNGVCKIGYVYAKKYWGMGYGTEALAAVIKYLFNEADAEVVYGECYSRNIASGKIMQKCGMQYEGTLKGRVIDKEGIRNDLISYSITKKGV